MTTMLRRLRLGCGLISILTFHAVAPAADDPPGAKTPEATSTGSVRTIGEGDACSRLSDTGLTLLLRAPGRGVSQQRAPWPITGP